MKRKYVFAVDGKYKTPMLIETPEDVIVFHGSYLMIDFEGAKKICTCVGSQFYEDDAEVRRVYAGPIFQMIAEIYIEWTKEAAENEPP